MRNRVSIGRIHTKSTQHLERGFSHEGWFAFIAGNHANASEQVRVHLFCNGVARRNQGIAFEHVQLLPFDCRASERILPLLEFIQTKAYEESTYDDWRKSRS